MSFIGWKEDIRIVVKVAENLVHIEEKIDKACQNSGRNREEIKLIAVTKYVSIERAKEAMDAGILNLGENRDEGLLNKYEVLEGSTKLALYWFSTNT